MLYMGKRIITREERVCGFSHKCILTYKHGSFLMQQVGNINIVLGPSSLSGYRHCLSFAVCKVKGRRERGQALNL